MKKILIILLTISFSSQAQITMSNEPIFKPINDSQAIYYKDTINKKVLQFIGYAHDSIYVNKPDTIAVIMLYCDTEIKTSHDNMMSGGYISGYNPIMMWMYGFTVDDWNKPVQYFDENKKPLPKNIDVWISKRRKL